MENKKNGHINYDQLKKDIELKNNSLNDKEKINKNANSNTIKQ